MKFPKLFIVWTAGKNLALPDTLSQNTPPDLLTSKTTVEIQKKNSVFPCKRQNITTIKMQICSKNRT